MGGWKWVKGGWVILVCLWWGVSYIVWWSG